MPNLQLSTNLFANLYSNLYALLVFSASVALAIYETEYVGAIRKDAIAPQIVVSTSPYFLIR